MSGNKADGDGAGIYTLMGTTTLTNSTLSANIGHGYGGGIYNTVGPCEDCFYQSPVTLTNVTFDSNRAHYGGGLYNLGGKLIMTGGSFRNNEGSYFGGGIYNATARAILTDITFSGNFTLLLGIYGQGYGGGIYNGLRSSSSLASDLYGTNLTFDGNSASYGGALYNQK